MGCNVEDLTTVLGFSRSSLFAYRRGKARITAKAWVKLAEAERKAGITVLAQQQQQVDAEQHPDDDDLIDRLARIEELPSQIGEVSSKLDTVVSALNRLLERLAPDPIPFPESRHDLPFLGLVAAGEPCDVDYFSGETVTVDRDYGRDHCVYRINGRSMEPDYPQGSLIVVRFLPPGVAPPPSSVVVANDGSGPTCKRFETDEYGRHRLVSINPEFAEVIPVRGSTPIQGVVVDCIAKPPQVR